MKTNHLRPGTTVIVENIIGEQYDYVLKKVDILDMRAGEWDEVGLKIISYECSCWQHLLINIRHAWWLVWNKV